jgi:outer membrane protein, heavy metal efflux system
MNRFIFMTVVAGLSLSAQALTLDEALKTAAEISPEIHAARAQTQAATEEVRSAALWKNPELELEAEGIGGDQSGTDAAEYSVMVSQEFPMFGKTARRREVARYAAEAAHFEQLDTQREVETRIRRAFADAQAAEQLVEAHRGQVALSADFLSTVQARRDAGAASELDLISAEMQAEESRIELENAQRNLGVALRRLARLTSLSRVRKTDGVFFQPLENPVRPERIDAVPQLQIFQTLEKKEAA